MNFSFSPSDGRGGDSPRSGLTGARPVFRFSRVRLVPGGRAEWSRPGDFGPSAPWPTIRSTPTIDSGTPNDILASLSLAFPSCSFGFVNRSMMEELFLWISSQQVFSESAI